MNPLPAARFLRPAHAAAAHICTRAPVRHFSRQCLHHNHSPPSLLRTSIAPAARCRPAPPLHHLHHQHQQPRRHESTASPSRAPNPLTDRKENAPDAGAQREEVPSYEMTFTCRVCKDRSSHRISKQGYHKGTILITCPGCKNRHLIADHLGVC